MSEKERARVFEHCQMSWTPKGFTKLFTCRQCGESVTGDYHPFRRCPAATPRPNTKDET